MPLTLSTWGITGRVRYFIVIPSPGFRFLCRDYRAALPILRREYCAVDLCVLYISQIGRKYAQ
jgi:hypothetical protein